MIKRYWLLRKYARLKKRLTPRSMSREVMTGMQRAGLSMFDRVLCNREHSVLEICPKTGRRFVSNSGETIVLHDCSVTFIGADHYYEILYNAQAFAEMAERFDSELSNRLSSKLRIASANVTARIGQVQLSE